MSGLSDNKLLWNDINVGNVGTSYSPIDNPFNSLISYGLGLEDRDRFSKYLNQLYDAQNEQLKRVEPLIQSSVPQAQGKPLGGNSSEVVSVARTNPKIIPNNDLWNRFYKLIQRWEGGFNRDDAGAGAVNRGINLKYNRKWIPDKNNDGIIDNEDVRLLTEPETRDITYTKYFLPSGALQMSPAMGLYYADTYFNLGAGAAQKLMRDIIKSNKLADINSYDQRQLLDAFHKARLAYYASRPNAGVYGIGWRKRANDVYANALGLL